MKKLYILISALLILGIRLSHAQITGDTAVCARETQVYHAPLAVGASYSWTVLGGSVIGTAMADSILIQWGAAGNATVMVSMTNPTANYTLTVTIHPRPHPVISHTPYAMCPVDTGRNGSTGQPGGHSPCEKVCKKSIITYITPLHPGSTYLWLVTGAITVSGVNTNSITVNWDTTNFGSIVIYETNRWGCKDSAAICIEKVNLPKALFSSQNSVCKFSNTAFMNLSMGATWYQWYFGDGGTSNLFSPYHSYTTAGTYTVTLIAENSCHCTDTFRKLIIVDSTAGPAITCPSTVCAGTTASYSTIGGAGCIYTWIAQGGSIVSGQGTPSVTVSWGAGQLGMLGLHITGCSGVCSDTTWVSVPIVPLVATISGANKVCAGDCEYYTLPLFSGATYHWSIGGSCGTLTDSTCCEKVKICWSNYLYSCDDTLKVSYYDTFLHCGGTATKIIHMRPKLSIYGQSKVCANSIANYSSNAVCSWNISPSGPSISPGTPSSSITINWNGFSGTFVLTAVPVPTNQVCDDSTFLIVTVVAPPPAPLITGDTIICAGSTQSYCSLATGTVNWLLTGGTPVSAIGNCITVHWANTGPYVIQAYQQMANSPYCNSDTTTQNIHVFVAGSPVLTGSPIACANSTNTYATTTLYPAGTVYTWSLTPSNAGAILSPGTSSTQIQWGNNAPQNVTVTLSVNVCGSNYQNSIIVSLKPAPNPTVMQIGTLCAGGSAQLNATGGTSYTWSGPGGYSSITNPTTIVLNGLYQVTVTDPNGCSAHSQKNVTYVSGPLASISTGDPLGHCIGTSYTDNLCALGNPNYTYVWSNLATSQCITVSSPGSYTVTVTDISSGCTALSNVLTVHEDSCNGSGPGICTPNGSISFTHSLCNPMVFTNTSVNGSNFSWTFGDGGTSTQTSPTHTYTQAGFYLVTLTGNVPNSSGGLPCVLTYSMQIEIPLAAKFDFVAGCNGDSVCFTDHSTYTAGNNITSWAWNFGDAGTSTLQNPCHLYSISGTYIASLTVSNGTCTDTVRDTVVIAPSPTAVFSSSNPNCINNPVLFTDGSFVNINYWSWSFGDAGSSLLQNPSHTYINANTYPVTLIVHDIYGCKDTIVQNVVISAPSLTGNITALPDTIVCAGRSVTLLAPLCPTCSYLWNTGSVNDSIMVTTTGTYTVTITDVNGCPYISSINIIVNNGPPAVIQNNGSNQLCLGDFVTLSVPYDINWLYYWISNDGVNNGATTNAISVFPALPGTYTYQVAITDTTTGCSDTSLTYTVYVHPNPVAPTISSVGPNVVCHGDTIILVGTHPDTTVTFLWNTGDVNDTIRVTENGCYHLQVTDTNGCMNSASHCVTVNPLPEVCSFYTGCFDTCRPYTIHGPAGATTYQWLLNGIAISGATMPNYTATISGGYSVILTNSFGCMDTTGVLNLSLHDCDSLCSHLILDSVYCDSSGHHVMVFHVENTSPVDLTQVNLEVLQPNLNIAYAPNTFFTNVPARGSSPQLMTTIYNTHPGDVLCYRSHVSNYDSMGHELMCCYSDTQCVTVPPCPLDTNCCYFHYSGDSIWCRQTAIGTEYHFSLKVSGCGQLNITSTNGGVLNVSNPYTLSPGINFITGTYTSSTDSVLCLTLVTSHGAIHCGDTTICFHINCNQHPLPCLWDYNHQVCAGSSTSFNYYGNPVGVTITWSFPGGVPSTASGPGPHSILYPTAGVYPFSMTLTNGNGSTTCTDSITVIAPPIASITQTGATLNAFPAGMSYQWYTGPNLLVIPSATNQFFSPPGAGYYCVYISNNFGCSDSACIDFHYMEGIDELNSKYWSIYPNPNDGSFVLSINADKNETIEMKILNTLGQVIDRRVFDVKSGMHDFYIVNQNFISGVYLVELSTDHGHDSRRMIVR